MQRPEQILRQIPDRESGLTYLLLLRGHDPESLLAKFAVLAEMGAEVDVKIQLPASLASFAHPTNITLPYNREVERIHQDERYDSHLHDH